MNPAGGAGCACTYEAVQIVTTQGEHVGTTMVHSPSPTCVIH